MSDLKLHPALARQPGAWAEEDERFLALCRDIRAQGILCPLLVTAAREIVDGRHRWRAALRLGLERVPCIELRDGQALEVILGTLLARRHYTAGQRAYLVADLIQEAWQVAAWREKANRQAQFQANILGVHGVPPVENQPLTPKNCTPEGEAYNAQDGSPRTVEDYARDLGLSVRLLRQARQIWQQYRAHPEPFEWSDEALSERGLPPGTKLTLREYFEPAILDDEAPMGLGRVLEGMGQKITQREREEKYGRLHRGRADALASAERQLELFEQAWRTVSIRAREYWPKLPPEAQAQAYEALETQLEEAPEEFLDGLKAVVLRVWRRRRAGAAAPAAGKEAA